MIDRLKRLRFTEWGVLLSVPMLYIISALLFAGKDNAVAIASGLAAAALLVFLYVWASGGNPSSPPASERATTAE